MSKKTKPQPVIVPEENTVRDETWEKTVHSLIANAPELKSIGFAKDPISHKWVAFVITNKNGEISKVEYGEVGVKVFAEESAMALYTNTFMNGEE